MMSSTSPPEQNPRPLPVTTSTRASWRCGSSARTSRRSAYASNVRAFSLSGRLNVTVAIPSESSKPKCSHRSVNPAEARCGLTSLERLESGEDPAENERVDLARALVREHRLEVVHVADDRILEGHPVGPQDRPGLAADLQRLANIVELSRADLLRRQASLVLHPSEMQGQKHPLVHLERHIYEFPLRELERADRLPELHPRRGVLQGGLETCPPRSH